MAGVSVSEVVRRFGGRANRGELMRHATHHQIRAALEAGDLLRAARGIYVSPALPEPAIAAARCRGVLSHDSAAASWGLELAKPPQKVAVTVPHGARPPAIKGVRIYERNLTAFDLDGDRTTPLRSVLDCCTTMSFREALTVADSAARQVPGFLPDFIDAASAPGRGRAKRLLVARHVNGLAANPFESVLRADLISSGLNSFQPQVPIKTTGGVYRVDLADVRRRVVMEADSFAWHGDRAALDRDCRRYDELVRADWRVLRFSWEQVMFDPDWVVAVVRDVARAA